MIWSIDHGQTQKQEAKEIQKRGNRLTLESTRAKYWKGYYGEFGGKG